MTRPFRMIAILSIVVTLTGCTTVQHIETPLADRIPAGLLVCRDRPVPGAIDRQSDVAKFVVDLDAAGEDCRRKIGAVSQIVRQDAIPGDQP